MIQLPTEVKNFRYKNSELFKFDNKRVQIISLPTKDYGIELKALSTDLRPRAFHEVKKDKIVVTGIRVSKEAALCIMLGLLEQLSKDGVIE